MDNSHCAHDKRQIRANLGAFPALNRFVVSAHSRAVYMTSTHSHVVVQVRTTAQDCSRSCRVMQNYLFCLCGVFFCRLTTKCGGGYVFSRACQQYASYSSNMRCFAFLSLKRETSVYLSLSSFSFCFSTARMSELMRAGPGRTV